MTLLPVLALRWLPPPTTAFMVRAQWLAFWEGKENFRIRYQWVDWPDISRAAALAVVASEDQLFGSHLGFDFGAIAKAAAGNRSGRRLHGASTISQQTAKNLFLTSSRSFWRKGVEAYLTVLLELLWPKQRILEVYLNVAQFGDGVYGIEAACRKYYRKPAARLTAREAALLAATLPNPLVLRADKPSAYLLRRRDWILEQMRRLRPEALGEDS
ncbi:MAG: monofunctional biosynthetic peptidoglycan transglycosylase [Methylococcaceae bacterium]|nr:monofunctional biosynthetic peptidoglycan transglycosylase [Methylococcaceae bacterium]